jgi:2-polyprenyl-3-methyl-5-hydroxy-6-metoxy-1,4-benzoquinol methylase
MDTHQDSEPDRRVLIRSCPNCDSQDFTVLLCVEGWRLVQCHACQLAYLPEAPREEAIETDFEWLESFERERRQRWLASPAARLWTAALLLLRPNRARRAWRHVAALARPGPLLEVGAGDGRLAAEALRHGYEPLCIELSSAMARKAAGRVGRERVRVGRLEDQALTPASFESAVCISVLEHELHPRELLQRLYALLCPGGVLILKVPNFASWLRVLRGRRWSGYRWPEHVQYFTPQTLAALLRATGFKPVRQWVNPMSDNFWVGALKAVAPGASLPAELAGPVA